MIDELLDDNDDHDDDDIIKKGFDLALKKILFKKLTNKY